jgi:hypothetical protein
LFPIIGAESDKDYERRVLADKPPVKRPKVGPKPETYKILVIADTHVDYDYKEVNFICKCFRDLQLCVVCLFAVEMIVLKLPL